MLRPCSFASLDFSRYAVKFILSFNNTTLSYFKRIVNIISDKLLYCEKKEFDMKPLKTKVSITLDSDLLEELKVLAEQDDRSLSQYINLLLKERVKSEQAKQSQKS